MRKYWGGRRDVTEINSHIIRDAERPVAKRMSFPEASNTTTPHCLITQNDLIFESAKIDIYVAFVCYQHSKREDGYI